MKAKKILLVIVIAFASLKPQAQTCNLVFNPGFETTTSGLCTYTGAGGAGLGAITGGFASPWSNPCVSPTTPDLFNTSCFGSSFVDVPSNWIGTQTAVAGAGVTGTDGYAGLVCYVNGTPDFREFMKGQLSTPLTAGKCYYFEMYVSSADNSKYSVDKIGAYFSSTSITGGSAYGLGVTPQINYSGGVLNNTSGWVCISGTFTATGGEQYIYIGNFNSDATTTIVLNGWGGSGNAYLYVDNVSVFEYTANAGPDVAIDCGNTTTLNATTTSCLPICANLTYSWSPASGIISGSNTANPVVSPTSTTNYIVSISAGPGSCSKTDTVTVTVSTPTPLCTLTIPTAYDITSANVSAIFPTSVSGQNIRISGVLTVDQSVNFSGCNIIMLAGSRIDVLSGQNLTVTGKTHMYGCCAMWDGIYVKNGGVANLLNSTFIEDAQNAVNIEQGATATIDGVIFNRNFTAVKLSANTSPSSPVSIKSCVFTCRDIPSFTSTASNYINIQVWTNVTSVTPWSPMGLKNGQVKSYYGVYATDVNNLSVGSDLLSSIYNGFDNQGCGVYLDNTNALIQNNKFQKMVNGSACFSCPSILGTGVFSYGSSGLNIVQVGGTGTNEANTFYDLWRAIDLNNYQSSVVLKNTIDNSSTMLPMAIYGIGKGGIIIKPSSNNTIQVEENTVNNCVTGIWINRNSVAAISTLSMKINNNNPISANASGYCSNGIYVQDLLAGTTVVPVTSEILDNVITECATGILLLNTKKIVNVKTNLITTRYAASGNTNGIKIQGCQNLRIENNHTKYNVTTASLIGGNPLAYGVYLQSSSNMIVKCNIAELAAKDFVFEGPCSSLTSGGFGITRNTMRNAQNGFVLKSSGIIGAQGNGTSLKSDNIWDLNPGSSFSVSQTLADASNATSSPLYVTTGAGSTVGLATNPVTNTTIGGTAYVSPTSIITSTGTAATCGYVPFIGTESATDFLKYANDLILITDQHMPVFSSEGQWQRIDHAYRELKNNTEILSVELDYFVIQTDNSNHGKLFKVEQLINNEDLGEATSLNNAITPDNLIEKNQKAVNEILLKKTIELTAYTIEEEEILFTIASQCPLSGGNAVYQARIIYSDIKNNIVDFLDNCDVAALSDNSVYDQTYSLKIYPNPNKGFFKIDFANSDSKTISIFDCMGQLVFTKSNVANRSMEIDLSNLPKGLYVVNVIGAQTHANKIIIE